MFDCEYCKHKKYDFNKRKSYCELNKVFKTERIKNKRKKYGNGITKVEKKIIEYCTSFDLYESMKFNRDREQQKVKYYKIIYKDSNGMYQNITTTARDINKLLEQYKIKEEDVILIESFVKKYKAFNTNAVERTIDNNDE